MFLLDSNVFIYFLNDDLTEEGNRLFEQAIASGHFEKYAFAEDQRP